MLVFDMRRHARAAVLLAATVLIVPSGCTSGSSRPACEHNPSNATVACNGTVCGGPLHSCCNGPSDGAGICFGPTPCKDELLKCDDAEDCDVGSVCCASVGFGGTYLSSGCVTPEICRRDPAALQLCSEDCECPSGQKCVGPDAISRDPGSKLFRCR